MLMFAMDCWFVGIGVAILTLTGWHHKPLALLAYEGLITSAKVGLVMLVISNWMFSFGIMWSMWD
jgi:hypothetical protein